MWHCSTAYQSGTEAGLHFCTLCLVSLFWAKYATLSQHIAAAAASVLFTTAYMHLPILLGTAIGLFSPWFCLSEQLLVATFRVLWHISEHSWPSMSAWSLSNSQAGRRDGTKAAPAGNTAAVLQSICCSACPACTACRLQFSPVSQETFA